MLCNLFSTQKSTWIMSNRNAQKHSWQFEIGYYSVWIINMSAIATAAATAVRTTAAHISPQCCRNCLLPRWRIIGRCLRWHPPPLQTTVAICDTPSIHMPYCQSAEIQMLNIIREEKADEEMSEGRSAGKCGWWSYWGGVRVGDSFACTKKSTE